MNISSRGYGKYKEEIRHPFTRWFFRSKITKSIFKKWYKNTPKTKVITDYKLISYDFIK
jgi:hypothetical protein